jgi:4-amino-4-deoxy-L-arabinose transferase-like glycosyltransferase
MRWRRFAPLLLLPILALALFLRLEHLSWDEGYLFHPDERQILVTVDRLSFPWPPDWGLLLSPQSPWNPGFFAYGSLPLYLLRVVASLLGLFDPNLASLHSSYLVGRALSALFDVGSVYLLYRLGRALYDEWVGLVGAALLSTTVLHIQLAHFYTVDTLLTFFVLLTLLQTVLLVRRPSLGRGALAGGAWGLALASKVSAAPLIVPIALAWILGALAQRPEDGWMLRLWRALRGMLLTSVAAMGSFLLCQPYALLDIVAFLVDVIQEGYMARGLADIPYTRQFIGTVPYLYPLRQMVLWSMGLPLGVAGLAGALAALSQAVVLGRRGSWARLGELAVPLGWVAVYFGIVGGFHTKFLRYMLPILPLLCLWAAWGWVSLLRLRGRRVWPARALGGIGLVVTLLGTGAYALAYRHVYTERHPWIQATAWLCQNLPPKSHIMVEHWDDPLPLLQGTGDLRCYRAHEVTVFPAYSPDDTAKLELLLQAIQENDFIILSSNRLYNTIPRLPRRYPLTSRYYELLLGERLGYELVYFAAVYPRLCGVDLVDDTFADPPLPKPRLIATWEAAQPQINLGRADESFTVYDHPKPLVFRKTRQLSREELLDLFGAAAQNLPPPTAKGGR